MHNLRPGRGVIMIAVTGSSGPSGGPKLASVAGFSGFGSRMAIALALLMMAGGMLPLASAWHHGGGPPAEFWYHGRVLDDDTGGGLVNATVTLWDLWEQAVATYTSGPGGHFGGLLPMGEYRVRAEAQGYYGLDSWMGEWWSEQRYEEYRLFPLPPPNATISGHIQDTLGLPLAGVEVVLNQNNLWHHQGQLYHSRLVTNASGNYTFAMAAGDYNLDVRLDGYFHEGWGFTAFNGSAHHQNFTLESYTETALIMGYLTEPDSSPAVPAQIELHRDWGYHNQSFSDTTGYYEMWVAPGNYTGYNVWGEGYQWQDNWSLALSLAANSTTWLNATLQLAPDEIFVSGTVYDEYKQPVPNATVKVVKRQTYHGPAPGQYVKLESVHNTTFTLTNGNFLMHTYRWGDQHLEVTAPGYYSTQEWWYDSGRNNSLMELFIGPAPNATISGRMTYPNGTGAANFFVEFNQIHEGGDPDWVWLNNATHTNATGHYSMDYWGIRTEVWVHDNESHRFGRYEYYQHPHTFPAGSSTYDITLVHSTEDNIVRGWVKHPNGTGLANITVHGSNWWGFEQTLTDATGHYELNMVSNRENWLDVWYRPRPWEYPMLEEGYNQFYFADLGETIDFNITLNRRSDAVEDATVHGQVLARPGGTPLDNAQVRVNSLNEEHRWWSNWTHTNVTGHYEMDLPGGEFEFWADSPGYMPNRTRSYVESGSTANEDLTLTPYPPLDATLKGYVENEAGDPLKGLLFWGLMMDKRLTHMRDHGGSLAPMFDNFENYAFESTFSSNTTGYYELAVPAGRIYTGVFDLSGNAEGSQTNFIDITAGGVMWLNYTLGNYTAPSYSIFGQVLDEWGNLLDWDTEVLLLKKGDFRGDTGLHLGHNGTFSFAVTPGDYVLLVDRFDRNCLMENVTITTSNYYTTFTLYYPNTTLLDRGVDFPNSDDWDNGTLYINVTTYEDVMLARFMVDYYLGDADGTIDLAEALQVQTDLHWDLYGSQPSLLPGGTSHNAFNLDGRHYRVDGASFSLSVSGALGPVDSSAPLVVAGSQDIATTAPVPANDPHRFRIYATYDEMILEQSYWVSPPEGWKYLGDNDPENIAVSGTDPVLVDPKGDPKPWDDIFEVLVDLEFETDLPRLMVEWSPGYPDNTTNISFNVTALGLPVAGAQLTMTGFANATLMATLSTNISGVALNGPLPPGDYWVEVTKADHIAARELMMVLEQGAQLPLEIEYLPPLPDDRTEVTVTLTNLTTHSPVSGASVEVVRIADFASVWNGTSDGAGQVAFTLTAGDYLINATALGYSNTSRSLVIEAALKRLNITIDPIYPTIGMDIWVLVVDDLGNPVANATLILTRANNDFEIWNGTTDAKGTALLPASLGLEGQYRLTAEYPGYDNDTYALTIHPHDEHNPEREGDSFLPGLGGLSAALAMVGVATVTRRRKSPKR